MMNKHIETLFKAYLNDKFKKTKITLTLKGENLSGWETEIYFFDISSDVFSNSNIALRLYPHFNQILKAEKEFKVMKLLKKLGYIVPDVFLLEFDSKNPFKRPFIVMEQIKGETLTNLVERSTTSVQEYLMLVFIEKFVELHKIGWTGLFIDFIENTNITTLDLINTYLHGFRSRIKDSQAIFVTPILEWLSKKSNYIENEKLSIIHGDFHSDNVLVDDRGTFYVIDWASSDISDFRFDLGWSLVLAHLYIGKQIRDKLLNLYGQQHGKSIQDIQFFEVFALLRRLTDIILLVTEAPEKHGMRQGTTFIIKSEKELLSKLEHMIFDYTQINLNLDKTLINW